MIRISGIEYQSQLEKLPVVNKKQLATLVGKKGRNLDKKISLLTKKGYLLSLKRGLYTTQPHYLQTNKSMFAEYTANILRSPSYLSLEYVLSKHNLIPEGVYAYTSITTKSSRVYQNLMGNFLYQSVKQELYLGYSQQLVDEYQINVASKSKALFDWLYLKKLTNLKQELLVDLRINWEMVTSQDMKEFSHYASQSGSKKMQTIANLLQEKL